MWRFGLVIWSSSTDLRLVQKDDCGMPWSIAIASYPPPLSYNPLLKYGSVVYIKVLRCTCCDWPQEEDSDEKTQNFSTLSKNAYEL